MLPGVFIYKAKNKVSLFSKEMEKNLPLQKVQNKFSALAENDVLGHRRN